MKTVLKILAGVAAIMAITVVGFLAEANWQIARQEITSADHKAPGAFFTIENSKLYVLMLGDPTADPTGAPIVLVHGFSAAGLATWLPWAEKLHAAGRSVILPDMLGFGHSERVSEVGEHYTLPARARQELGLVNAIGNAMWLDLSTRAPHVAASKQKKIISISSTEGSLTGISARPDVNSIFYRASKSALNMAMINMAKALKDKGIIVVMPSPGLVQTDFVGDLRLPIMISAEQSAAMTMPIIARVTMDDMGKYFRHTGGLASW